MRIEPVGCPLCKAGMVFGQIDNDGLGFCMACERAVDLDKRGREWTPHQLEQWRAEARRARAKYPDIFAAGAS